MATSPGISWSLSIQPLLTASYSSLNETIPPELSSSIIASERDIFSHDEEYEPFYSSFVALASHYLSASAGDVSKSNLQTITGACKVLLQFLLQRLQTQNESCTISSKYLMILIKGLCTGQSSLPKADIVTFTAMMKSAKPPMSIRFTENEGEELEPKEPKRTRLDTETNIFDQMTSVFEEITPTQTTTKVEPEDDTIERIPEDTSTEMKTLFGKRNLASLSQLNGGNILVDVCLELTFLKRYIQGYKDALAGGPFVMPSTLSEALTTRNSFQQLLSNISIVWRIVSLPILEPLTVKRLEKIITITMGCLYASVAVATSNTVISLASGTPTKGTSAASKEEETDGYAANIVQKTLEIYSCVSGAIHTSTRAGGNIAQNLNLLATWLLLHGLQGILALTPAMVLERKDSRSKSTGETPQKTIERQTSRPSSGKSSFQGLDVLSVALGLQALQLLHKLFVDLQIEGVMPNMGGIAIQQQQTADSRPVLDVAILAPLPAWKRIQKLMAVFSLQDLMFTLAPAAFKKACFLQKLKQGSETSETSSSSASDSNTFYEDDFSSSDESSDEDEDSEPILGHFMVEIMSPSSESKDPEAPPPLPPRFDGEHNKRCRKISGSDSPSLIPDKREPDGFISLSAGILQFLNTYFISSSDEVLQTFIRDSLTEEHMVSLAQLIKDLDRESAKLGKGKDKVFEELSVAISRFSHSLVASGCLSDKLQDFLLSQLGISLNSGDPWPLSAYPRSLAILAEILLLRQQKEREAKKMISQSETAVVNIWLRFMEAVSKSILKTEGKSEPNEDVNVEHIQLLLFLFHSLPLMQKKALLLQLAQNIIRVTTNTDQKVLLETLPSSLCRLMLILDYLLHNFYDPPPELLDQVQWNLFTVHTLNLSPEENVPMSKHSIWFPCQEVEDNFRKYLTPQELIEVGVMTPRFYNLGPTGINTQEAPKVDGLACSFLLSNAEQLNYGDLYKSCIRLMLAGTGVDRTKPKLSLLDACTIQYHFTIMWRLLACLPPSIPYLRSLEAGSLQLEPAELLHTLRWAPRLGQKAFIGWIKDSTVKQGYTTQQAEALLSNANKTANCLTYDIRLSMNFIQDQIGALPLVNQRDLIPMSDLPGLTNVLLMDAVAAKLQVTLDEAFTKAMSEIDPHSSMNVAQDLIPASQILVEAYSVYVRSCMMGQLSEGAESQPLSPRQLRATSTVMSITAHNIPKMYFLGSGVISSLPSSIKTVVEGWTDKKASEFPELGSWNTDYCKDIIPVESYIDVIQRAHISQLSDGKYNISLSMKHVLNSLSRLATDLVIWCDTNSSKDMVRVLFPMIFDATTEHLASTITLYLERFLGPRDGEQFSEKMYEHIVRVCHELLLEFSDAESGLDEKIFTDCLRFLELSLEKPMFLKAFEKIYLENSDLSSILLSSARENLSPQYACKVLKFFNKLLHLADGNNKNAKNYKELCKSLNKLADTDKELLQNWLSKMIIVAKEEDEDSISDCRQLLKTFTLYLIKDSSPVNETVAQAILSALIPLGDSMADSVKLSPRPAGRLLSQWETLFSGFPELMGVMQILAGVGQGAGHTRLFDAATNWLAKCKVYLVQKDVMEKVLQNGKSGQNIMNTLCCLLLYIGEILGALKKNTDRCGAVSPPLDHEVTLNQEPDSDWGEDIGQEEEDSAGEDSDEESLNNKLCTFTITQKEFMNQHWYHCHTCKMVDGVGVCTVCAKVCHKDHDLTYAKFGSFFCDCGAKEDGSCKALVKRTAQSGINSSEQVAMPSAFSMETNLPSLLRRRLSSPSHSDKVSDKATEQSSKARELLCRQVEGSREELLNTIASSNTVETVLEILDNILPTLTENYQTMSPTGSLKRAQAALEELHKQVKNTETTDQLMAVTLGSQEGAFENVRMSYSGDQGQQIRQLITAHMLRRVAMCVLASPQGKRQHLAVSHEKGKITILQLSALLKQADSSKKKLTLTRLASAPIPFTVLSITGNPCNEDYLAVCGLKDCHVLTFSSSGSVADHLVLHPTLATGNFIIKALWLPGTQTELAIVTADFVKIYNLSTDAVSPQYFFLLPSGKIRDVTFVFSEEGRYIVLMSSSGYIYTEAMDDSSSARHGPFYITNVIEVKHNDLKDVNSQVAGGGLSVYYSHVLQLLFFSYSQGKNLCASVEKDLSSTITVFPITFKSSNGGAKGGNSSQPLVQWSEVPGHTGLLYCMTQTSNNPVVLMIKPDAIMVQEIKVVPAKAKIQDVVAIRHNASNSDQQRTTMILLCEDGSLRIYMANVDNTNFWLSPYLQPQSPISVLKPAKKKKVTKSGRPTGSVSFPIDFFEHCLQSNDLEFGGNDILQIYNVQQVKHRLNTTGMYIASTKPSGFSIEITKTTNTTVMVGVRVLVGSQSIDRAPMHLEVFGRTTMVNCTRPRWVDMPFTREESLSADKKFTLFVGESTDPNGATMVDSIKVFTKTKEAFGWPEEPDEFQEQSTPKPAAAVVASSANNNNENEVVPVTGTSFTPLPLTSADKLLSSALEVLDGAFASCPSDEKDQSRQKTLEIATQLLTLATPSSVQQHTKSLMASLFISPQVYHAHKDGAQLSTVIKCLSKEKEGDSLDVEGFQRLIVTARSVAVARPGNLVKFADKGTEKEEVLEVTDLETEKEEPSVAVGDLEPQERCHFVSHLMETFWKLLMARPPNPMLAPVCLPGLAHVDATVGALVEIIHAFTLSDLENVPLACKHYTKLLMAQDSTVSFACKQAMIRCLRPRTRRKRVFIPETPPRCSSPGGGDDDDDDDQPKPPDQPDSTVQAISIAEDQSREQDNDNEIEPYEIVEGNEPMVLEPPDPSGARHPLEQLLQAGGHFPPVVDIPPDADDETMVELAIALSLQDQSGGGANIPLGLQGLRLAASNAQNAASFEECHLSDTTASAPGSDDEIGSNAATDGSTLRTSPAEHAGSGGSESAGSAEESIPASGRSSMYGDRDRGGRSETSSVGVPSSSLPQESDMMEPDQDTSVRLHSLRLMLLERMIQYLPEVSARGGVPAIPFMQVVLMLTSDLDSEEDKDRGALEALLNAILRELDLSGKELDSIACRSKEFEVKLVYLRLLSVLLSRTKAGTKPSSESSSFISNTTANALLMSGAVQYCLTILKNLLPYWKNYNPAEEETSPLPGQLLKPHPQGSAPDMSPFFLRQYVKGHANDVFEDYPQLLTEMVLRLPYQLKKIGDSVSSVSMATFDQAWHTVLSEYMMTQQTPFVKKQVRKLLLFICGSKDKYRQLRDLHAIDSHLQAVIAQCRKGGLETVEVTPHSIILPYDSLLTLIEHLKVCSDIATSRPVNWQRYCQNNEGIVAFLVKASISLDEGVAPTLLQLLQCALCGSEVSKGPQPQGTATGTSPGKQKKTKDKDKDKDKNEDSDDGQKHDDSLCVSLIQVLNKILDRNLLTHFIRTFLLESNATAIRWQAHSLVHQIYKNSSLSEQEGLMELMWLLWQELPLYGRKAAQFVDLLGYFVLKTPQTSEKKTKEYLDKAIAVLKDENKILANHPNAQIYNMLQGLVDFDGYYLESDPCLVCNNPEVPYTSLKLTNIKVDSKFTTSTQIVKLVGSYNISKISLRITDLKRTKMVRVMSIYYNNRTVQAVVELKNKPGLWHKARKMTLTAGQTDVKIEFPIPIVACNLMIEYSDFYDNLQATAETLQCPRCSASVPANPGVCGNCGENVFQCHKCRAINYDEKDPFLCNACGFCKYAKFDLTLNAKPCCAVDPIENEDDRKKAISTINSLLEKADRIYKQLQLHRPALENLLIQVADHSMDRPDDGGTGGPGGGVPGSAVNKAIQHLALQYCGESKSSFDELSKIIQKVLACRRELVDYDRQQRQVVAATSSPVTSPRDPPSLKAEEVLSCRSKKEKAGSKPSTCYGCASSAVEHCITLLRALVTNTNLRQILCSQGMIQELIDYNLRRGTLQVRAEVRSLLCLLTKDSRRGTEEMNNIIMTRIASAVKGHLSNPYLGSSVRHEILLLGSSLKQQDTCWELRVRCVIRLFLMGMQMKQPLIMESVTLPCLRILQYLMTPEKPLPKVQTEDGSQEGKEDSVPSLLAALPAELHVDCRKWLQGDPKYSFQNWKKCLPKHGLHPQAASGESKEGEKKEKEEERKMIRAQYLMEKYATRWQQKMWKLPAINLQLVQSSWLQHAMFSRSSLSARQTATKIIEDIAQVPARKKEIIDMLTSCLDLVGQNGEYSLEYLKLYQRLIVQEQWKFYLAIKGVLLQLGDLITLEVEKLQSLEETTLSSDLAQGFALKAFTELLALLVQQKEIKQRYKNRLVGYVLNGYLSLKKLLVQRTKLIDETQDKLLELLEDLTTGTESETKEFMQVCVQTIKKYPLDDQVSPVFIFERLCSIIFPEENDVGEFFMILEKDPQQEDFLQGRMLGNPYSCNEVGLGPLMRDVKNKICQDCELVALLEDDTGMELLVNKKIISLDLPVKDVYKKVWAPEHGEGEPMQVIYRMRGLLGDATEDMVNSLDNNTQEDVDKEEVFRMANVLSLCGGDGLKVMLNRLESIKDLVLGKPLMLVLLKLFGFAVNVKANRQELIKPEMNTITVMLRALNLALWAEQESGTTATKGQTISEQILQIMETIMIEASSQSQEDYTEFSKLCGDTEQLMMLLERINSAFVRANSSVLQALMRLIPFLAFGEADKMLTLINHFKPYLDFSKFDTEHSQDEKVHLDCFCTIATAIENNANGIRLKDMIVEQGLVKMALDYILAHAPEVKTLLATDSEVWKDFLSKPSLNFILRLLTGISNGHAPTQLELGNHLIPILHKLEQVSSDKHTGTMAENLMEALKTNATVAAQIEDVRQQTKTEKKRLAMAVRKKHLGALGMTTNAKGQVTVSSSVLKQMEDIKEETGLTCCICREGYRYQPQKVLAIYTFTKRANLDDYENKQRKTVGFYTVSHFNVIHVDCHTAAVRLARGREEWESAALQNANTKCNGLLPLWGPQVQESAFATCLARHNTYLQECTGVRDPSYPFTVHDLKMLLLKFAEGKSFSDESGGGGRQSNIHVLAYIMHMALYVINTTRSANREEKNLNNFLDTPKDRWLENAWETESPLYYAVMALHIMPPEKWKLQRMKFLERLLALAHIRNTVAIGGTSITDKVMKDYIVYKPYLVFFGLVNGLYTSVFKKVVIAENDWSKSLADFIRNNDKPIIEACDKLLGVYQDEMLPCESFSEFCDVVGLLEDIPNPDSFVTDLMAGLP